MLRPGRITKEYVEGKRVSYTNPFRFLLSVAIVYLLMMSVTGNFTELNKSWTDSPSKINLKDNLKTLEFESETDKNEVLAAMDSIEYAIKKDPKIKLKDSLFGVDPSLYFKKLDSTNDLWERYTAKVDFFKTTIKEDTLYIFKDVVAKYDIVENFENKTAFSMANSLNRIQLQPGTFISSLISKLPFATFFFLPIFAFFIWLAYIRKNYTYIDNLIFSFHNQSLFFILLIINFLVDSIFNTVTSWIFLFIFALYLYKARENFTSRDDLLPLLSFFILTQFFLF